jgi:polysaccharide deacetylase 2 family uncharacterized protein YibQ
MRWPAITVAALIAGAAIYGALTLGHGPTPPSPQIAAVPLPPPPPEHPAPETAPRVIPPHPPDRPAKADQGHPDPIADLLAAAPPIPDGPTETAPWEEAGYHPPDKPPATAAAIPVVAPVAGPADAPWKRNAIRVAAPPGRPMIAIVIDDMGLDRRRSDRMVALPAPLTLSYMPYALDLAGQTGAAHARGHELLLHMPMEPEAGLDPGPNAMMVGLGRDELLRRLDLSLASFQGYIGINNHMGSKFTADPAGMAVVLSELQRRGLMFLDSRTTPHSAAPPIIQQLHLPALARDVFLDNVMSVEAVRANLVHTEEVARHQGHAIAIGHPKDPTAEALAQWLPTAAGHGFSLVPLSALLEK